MARTSAKAVASAPAPVVANANSSQKPVRLAAHPRLITDGDDLERAITETISAYANVQERIHVTFVSALWWAAVHGRPEKLTRIYNALSSNDQGALKLYLRLYASELGLGHRPEGETAVEISAAVDEARFVSHTQKEGFTVIPGKSEQRKAWVKLINDRLIEPDEKLKDFPVLYRNNFAMTRMLGDIQALEGIISSANRILKPSKGTTVSIHEPTRKFLEKLVSDTETLKESMANQLSLSEG